MVNRINGLNSVREIMYKEIETEIFNETFTKQLTYELINHMAQIDMIEEKNHPNYLYITIDRIEN